VGWRFFHEGDRSSSRAEHKMKAGEPYALQNALLSVTMKAPVQKQ
jgi:hypothetical protein